MQILTGTIQEIEANSKKKMVALEMDKERAFIEFRGSFWTKLLSQLKPGDIVETAVCFNGSVSKASGVRFNNLVGKAIKKV